MKIKKFPFALSFATAALLVVGTTAFAHEDSNSGMDNMMNSSNGNGMMNMMENGNMSNMMEAMNSPEGQKMLDACNKFMDTSER
ncbi:hypothetical protein [Salirhabdus salicampi]|uniref:hypothetical protein n=1 Tax=Salirhabdus salicampi TaxID=476102 RepID=UPI0020C3B992|nr:hypothetical protein [Salirhabdus salicampi]MCP8616350.1 hypothetical protein [Salirhabdus salicampi]